MIFLQFFFGILGGLRYQKNRCSSGKLNDQKVKKIALLFMKILIKI